MLNSTITIKPLYRFQRSLDYKKHKLKLRQIKNKSFSLHNGIPQMRPWVKENLKSQMQKLNKQIQSENQKLLSKLMKISTRNSFKNQETTKGRDNPFRKNWLKSIKKQNQQFGDKLIKLRSSLQYSRFSKSISEYQKVKKTMMSNRKAKLPTIGIKANMIQNPRKIMKTQPITIHTEESQQNEVSQMNTQSHVKKINNCMNLQHIQA